MVHVVMPALEKEKYQIRDCMMCITYLICLSCISSFVIWCDVYTFIEILYACTEIVYTVTEIVYTFTEIVYTFTETVYFTFIYEEVELG